MHCSCGPGPKPSYFQLQYWFFGNMLLPVDSPKSHKINNRRSQSVVIVQTRWFWHRQWQLLGHTYSSEYHHLPESGILWGLAMFCEAIEWLQLKGNKNKIYATQGIFDSIKPVFDRFPTTWMGYSGDSNGIGCLSRAQRTLIRWVVHQPQDIGSSLSGINVPFRKANGTTH